MVDEGQDLPYQGLTKSFHTPIFDHALEINLASADADNSSH
jgi:hypothetical protein